mgnify:CR=1 FL=1
MDLSTVLWIRLQRLSTHYILRYLEIKYKKLKDWNFGIFERNLIVATIAIPNIAMTIGSNSGVKFDI